MTDGEAFRTGWDHAAWLLSYLAGTLLPVLVVIGWIGIGVWTYTRITHWIAVARVRRDARRSGRIEGPGWNGAD